MVYFHSKIAYFGMFVYFPVLVGCSKKNMAAVEKKIDNILARGSFIYIPA
jgi:hypothetical protein